MRVQEERRFDLHEVKTKCEKRRRRQMRGHENSVRELTAELRQASAKYDQLLESRATTAQARSSHANQTSRELRAVQAPSAASSVRGRKLGSARSSNIPPLTTNSNYMKRAPSSERPVFNETST